MKLADVEAILCALNDADVGWSLASSASTEKKEKFERARARHACYLPDGDRVGF